MATVGSDDTPAGRSSLSFYGSFERLKGGLLFVAQAVSVLVSLLAHWLIGPHHPWLATLAILASYGAYFAVRWPLWRVLYRQLGHLESEGLLREARDSVWAVLFLAFVLPLGLVVGGDYTGPFWPLLGGSVTAAAIAVVFGRLPVDGSILVLTTITLHHTWLVAYAGEIFRNLPAMWLAFAGCLAIWGLIQHYSWIRSGVGQAPSKDALG